MIEDKEKGFNEKANEISPSEREGELPKRVCMGE